MFDNRAGRSFRRIKFCDQFKRRIRVVDVVIGKFFSLMLHRRRDALTPAAVGVKGGGLMRVFSVTQALGKCASKRSAARHRLTNRISHTSSND